MTIANAVARQDETITVDETSHIVDPIPERGEIKNEAPVYFQNQDSQNFVGDPQTANDGWDAATFVNTGGAHRFESDDGSLEAGTLVRIASNSATLASDAYKFMYSTTIGWAYYDKKRKSGTRSGKMQLWKISKTSHKDNSSGNRLHYWDRVTISNGNWPKANLGINGSWLQCMNADPTIWVLRAEPKA